jgi:hypothetical protein
MKPAPMEAILNLADKNLLPPIDWHINNLSQVINHLSVLQCPWIAVFDIPLALLSEAYTQYINSYAKADRRLRLQHLYDLAHTLVLNSSQFDEKLYRKIALPIWEKLKTEAEGNGNSYMTFEQYIKRSGDMFQGFRDFALGLQVACKLADPEPEKNLYDNLA